MYDISSISFKTSTFNQPFVNYNISQLINFLKIYTVNKAIYSILILTLLFFSCGSDLPVDSVDLNGTWEIVQAKRNGDITSTLDKAFFMFSDNEVKHNFNGDTVSVSYTKSKYELSINDEMLKTLTLKSVSKDTVEFKTKIANHKFEFLMHKVDE